MNRKLIPCVILILLVIPGAFLYIQGMSWPEIANNKELSPYMKAKVLSKDIRYYDGRLSGYYFDVSWVCCPGRTTNAIKVTEAFYYGTKIGDVVTFSIRTNDISGIQDGVGGVWSRYPLTAKESSAMMFHQYSYGFLGVICVVAFIYTSAMIATIISWLGTKASLRRAEDLKKQSECKRQKELQDLYDSNAKERVFNFGVVDYEKK